MTKKFKDILPGVGEVRNFIIVTKVPFLDHVWKLRISGVGYHRRSHAYNRDVSDRNLVRWERTGRKTPTMNDVENEEAYFEHKSREYILWPKEEDPEGSEAEKFHNSFVKEIKEGKLHPAVPSHHQRVLNRINLVYQELRKIDQIEQA